uniref:Uncharacterized protein n=1 Tax=Cucumis melo TaxID=3656 RepID=A0A9I9EA98_CUCME
MGSQDQIIKNWVVVKYILKYFRILKDYVIVYSDKDPILIGYTNSDFEKCYKVYIEIRLQKPQSQSSSSPPLPTGHTSHRQLVLASPKCLFSFLSHFCFYVHAPHPPFVHLEFWEIGLRKTNCLNEPVRPPAFGDRDAISCLGLFDPATASIPFLMIGGMIPWVSYQINGPTRGLVYEVTVDYS